MDAVDVPPPSCLGEVCWSNDQVSPVCWGSSAEAPGELICGGNQGTIVLYIHVCTVLEEILACCCFWIVELIAKFRREIFHVTLPS